MIKNFLKNNKIIFSQLFLISISAILFILITSCSGKTTTLFENNQIINGEESVIINGTIIGNDCNSEMRGKCIIEYGIKNYSFYQQDYNLVKNYYNKNVEIEGDLIQIQKDFSCQRDYFDGLQHPLDERCEENPFF